MEENFRCRLVNELGDVLKINLSEDHPAWMDLLNTLCGVHPVEWIGRNRHDKVIQFTSELKKRVLRICAANKNAKPSLDEIERFFNDQPDGSFISFLREGVVLGNADNRMNDALIKSLVANYTSLENRKKREESDNNAVLGTRKVKSIFCIVSDGEIKPEDLPRNYPEGRLSELLGLLRVATDMSMSAMRNGNNFWRFSELRQFIKSETVAESVVGCQIVSIVQRLKDLDDKDVVVFGVMQSANETQLTTMAHACRAIKAGVTLQQFYDQRMANERVFSLNGYSHRSFTDLGFTYKIAGSHICRFCGRSVADGVTFKKEPHAISYFWGNHNLLGAGECDDCNGRFGETLEPQAHRYYLPTMINCGVTGRGKDPRVAGENFALSLGKTNILSTETDNVWERLCNGEEVSQQLNDSQPVVKADVYRCFCKYVVSLISDEELPDFKETIRWIMKKRLSDGSLPPTLRNETDLDLVETPVLEIFTKKAADGTPKAYIIAFRFITNLWLFAVPYVRGCENTSLKRELLDFKNNFFSHFDFVQEDFSTEIFSYITTHVGLSINGKTEIRRVCDMTPEEQEEFYSHIPIKWCKK